MALAMALAQTGGQIIGEVRDPSGALIPNASVTATNTATNVARSTETNSARIYSFPGLTPGMYDVKVAMAGFATMTRAGVELQVQQTARVDFTLAVGQAQQAIEAAATAALLATENATVGTMIEERRIMDLPWNGRSFFSLVALSPNVAYGFSVARMRQIQFALKLNF
jgi:alpha-D-ribose 1-methylphosphonate 5-triphosphate synthase subunit PhnG